MTALTFTDPLNTTFTLAVWFTLPPVAPAGANNFTANLVAVDQAKAEYLCIDVVYELDATQRKPQAA
jgi:hypothetical protein